MVTINITVNQTYSTSETHAICQGGSYLLPWGGTATSAGPYPTRILRRQDVIVW
ncbi:MAG: hypothetical protein IPQ03_14130 [Bacteroidetes bacterium]|nr:hypothetical protein [Bacteroidota bacterium]